jgi:hypothetical protein
MTRPAHGLGAASPRRKAPTQLRGTFPRERGVHLPWSQSWVGVRGLVGVVDDPVDHGDGDGLVAEDGAPAIRLAERLTPGGLNER